MSQSFILEFWQDDGWYVGRLRGVPGVCSQGETLAELEENIRDAYRMVVEEEEDETPVDAQTKSLVIEV